MLYREEIRDLFSVADDYYLAHCISADFGMGKGIVIEFNKRYNMRNRLKTQYPNYLNQYIHQQIRGDCILDGKVLNLITKERYFHKPTIVIMQTALQKMRKVCIANSISKVAMPTIGAGLDRLEWNSVSNLIRNVFSDMEIEILVCRLL